MSLGSTIANGVDRLARLVFPPRCIGCEAYLDEARLACKRCRPTIERVESPKCPTCASPRESPPGFDREGVDEPCRHCRERPPAQDEAHALWAYRGVVADGLQKAKYGGTLWRLRALASTMGPWLERRLEAFAESEDAAGSAEHPSQPGIVPVPMHPSDLRDRGYNVPALLFRLALRETEYALDWDVVEKVEQTQPQAGLTRGERLDNVEGAFEVARPGSLDRDDWVIVDDVVTTGATASEVAGTLRKAGAERVAVVAAARAIWD